jgi:antitoxin component of MazEF toxin-antitoxin module
MIRTLTKTGNSMALRLTKEMREHLGINDKIDVQYVEGAIILRRPPMAFDKAKVAAMEKLEGTLSRIR